MTVSPAMVLDTNVVLDLLVFDDPALQPLRQRVLAGSALWLASAAMRAEFERVLGYPQIARRLIARAQAAAEVLAVFDRCAQPRPAAPKAPVTCRDPDDQIFVDLAVAHRAALFSKDRALRCMKKRLARLGVELV